MLFRSSIATLVVAVSAVVSCWNVVNGQGCTNTCPPINFGTVVPALCEGDNVETMADMEKVYSVCYPTNNPNILSNFQLEDFRGVGKVTVFANYYTGCNAGRRESGVFAHVAQRYYDQYGDRTTFIQSVKGGGTCSQWSSVYQDDAEELYPASNVVPTEMPLSVNDVNYEIRDELFTAPFGHPAYVILDGDLNVRHKFIGPCCGYESYRSCTADIARRLDDEISGYIDAILAETETDDDTTITTNPTNSPNNGGSTGGGDDGDSSGTGCTSVSGWSDWSECSMGCGAEEGVRFRWRIAEGSGCPSPIETQSCFASTSSCDDDDENACIEEFGNTFSIATVASGFDSPRDVAFHPTPGYHLGNYSEGRPFFPDLGEEAWVVNGGNHSVSIVASLGTDQQTTISRRDRGYYHYMANGTALSFNMVDDSTRTPDRDSFNYWAICNDNPNTYLGTKEPNYFMGPTLYDSSNQNRNLVNRLGEVCREEEPCYFLHSDMLHETPSCIGIAHDPEKETAYGNVYWTFDSVGNRETGQLVRYDFQQPHGPGSMDHSIAAVRRYVEVELARGPSGVHAGIVVHPTRREVYIAVPGANKIIVVGADSGEFARTAREEYPIYSNRLPSFEYSIWECADFMDFADSVEMPTGLALSPDGERLFVAERVTGKILVYEISTGARLYSIDTGFQSIGGMSFSPETGILHFVDDETNTLNSVQPTSACTNPVSSRLNSNFSAALVNAERFVESFSLLRDYECIADPIIPNASFFDQVHDDTGYADDNPDVQSEMAGMDAAAALLANRTDCGFDSELNFDALLLGGYFCHQCLPEQDLACDVGGTCTNVQWIGYTCDNEFFIIQADGGTGIQVQTATGDDVDPRTIALRQGVTYRFTVLGDFEVCYDGAQERFCASRGPLIIPVEEASSIIPFTVNGVEVFSLREPSNFFASEPTSEITVEPSQGPTSEPILDQNTEQIAGPSATPVSTPAEPASGLASSSVPGENDMPEEGGLSGGAVAGAVIAALVGVGIGVFCVIKISKADSDAPSTKPVEEQDPNTTMDSL